jgi:hypothetical protein
MSTTVLIEIAEEQIPFELDFTSLTWTAERVFEESDFPLIARFDEKRYEIYSDGTFAEEELS